MVVYTKYKAHEPWPMSDHNNNHNNVSYTTKKLNAADVFWEKLSSDSRFAGFLRSIFYKIDK